MRIICISDTHEQEDQITIPDGDLLIHSGDWTYKGSFDAIEKFLEWFSKQPHKFKCFCAGNHELGVDSGPTRKPKLKLIYSYCDDKTHYLEDSGININGLNIYGSPFQPEFYNWGFNLPRGKALAEKWAKIPDSTNVLITHGPCFKILDEAPRDFGSFENVGCKDLLKRVMQLKNLKLHCCGHIHNAAGQKEINNIKFVNASICTEEYKPTNKPIVIDL